MRFNYPRNQGRPWIVEIGQLVDGERGATVRSYGQMAAEEDLLATLATSGSPRQTANLSLR